MRYRMVRSQLFSLLFIILLLVSKPEAKNYVILSVTKEGLREVRVAYRGRLVLETSVMAGTSEARLAFYRASDKIRLVEMVSRDGLIEDCANIEDGKDVSSFVSDFSRVRPCKTLVSESDIMDVYLGIKNITDPMLITNHSNKNSNKITFSSVPANQENLTQDATGLAGHFYANRIYELKLTAKMTSPETSKIMQTFSRHFRIKKTSRECREFYREAKSSLELLSYLAEQPLEEAHAVLSNYLNSTVERGDTKNPHHRRYRHHHHTHHHQIEHYRENPENETLSSSRESQPPNSSSQTSSQKWQKDDFEKFQIRDEEDIHIETKNKIISELGGLHVQTELNTTDDSGGNFSTSALSVSSSDIQISNMQSSNIHSSHIQSSNIPSYNVQSSSIQSSNNAQSYHQKMNKTESLTPYLWSDDVIHDNATLHKDSHTVIVKTPDNIESPHRMDNAIKESEEYMADSPSSYLLSRSRSKRDLLTGWMIFPGTKWCGDGDIAENKKDLGYHTELDKCCRRHDLCPLVIPRLSWKYGMFNFRLHTISHCRCDRKFRKCLKLSNSPLAHLIGQIFFNVVGPQCFKFNKETTCLQRFWWGGCREWGQSKVAYVKKQRRFK